MGFKKDCIPWNKGQKTPKEVRKKLSEAHMGKKHSDETRKKISKANKGKVAWCKGKKLSEETKEKMRNKRRTPEARIKAGMAGKLGAKKRWQGHVKVKRKYYYKYQYKHQSYKEKYPNGATKKKRFTNMRYRARKRNAEGSHTFGEWELLKKQYGCICPACGKSEPEIKLTEDHIIPLSKGGSDYIENIQPLCVKCNTRKHARIIIYSNKRGCKTCL